MQSFAGRLLSSANAMKLTVTKLTKEFNRRAVFRDISFTMDDVDSLAITGRNGAGKSTLVKILSGLLSPTSGIVAYAGDGKAIASDGLRDRIGLVSPYLQMYDEFTATENLSLLSRIRSNNFRFEERSKELLVQFSLWEKRDNLVRTYSSGMKQRLKYVFALLHQPSLLLLDEPTSNLDEEGVGVVQNVVENQKRIGMLIIATNDAAEARWCKNAVHLG